MKTKLLILSGIAICIIIALSFNIEQNEKEINTLQTKQYKCLLKLTNYNQSGAYVTISLIKPDDKYLKTLYVFGDDNEWLAEMTKWWEFYRTKKEKIDAITSESIKENSRKQFRIAMPTELLDKGYFIRFETAVEDGNYYTKDIQIPFAKENINKKIKGSGYIEYIRISE